MYLLSILRGFLELSELKPFYLTFLFIQSTVCRIVDVIYASILEPFFFFLTQKKKHISDFILAKF